MRALPSTIDSCAVRRHCTWPAQRKKKCRVTAGADFPGRIGLMQAYLQPCSRSSNSVVIGLHQLRSSTIRCALLALPTPRTACLPPVEVVRVMAHDSCHGCCSAGQCRVCDWLDLLMPSMHDLHVNGRPSCQWGRALSPTSASAAISRESEGVSTVAKRFSCWGRRPESIHTFSRGDTPAEGR